MTLQVPIFFCEMLLDQGRFIGGDPVGRKCQNQATHELKMSGHLICESCSKLLEEEPERVTIPPIAYGREGQKRLAEHILASMLGKIREAKA